MKKLEKRKEYTNSELYYKFSNIINRVYLRYKNILPINFIKTRSELSLLFSIDEIQQNTHLKSIFDKYNLLCFRMSYSDKISVFKGIRTYDIKSFMTRDMYLYWREKKLSTCIKIVNNDMELAVNNFYRTKNIMYLIIFENRLNMFFKFIYMITVVKNKNKNYIITYSDF